MKEPSERRRRRTGMRPLVTLILTVVLVACGQPEEPQEAPPATQPDDPIAEKALADLATELGVAPADIGVVVSEAVTWNDGALGCPEPGKMYTQALVDGYRVVLEHDGVEYHYHAAEGGEPFHCPDASLEPRPGSSIPPPSSSDR